MLLFRCCFFCMLIKRSLYHKFIDLILRLYTIVPFLCTIKNVSLWFRKKTPDIVYNKYIHVGVYWEVVAKHSGSHISLVISGYSLSLKWHEFEPHQRLVLFPWAEEAWTSVQTSYSEEAPVQTLYSEEAPVQTLYSKEAPVQTLYSEEAPVQTLYSEEAPVQTLYSEKAPV